jgi:hypothetical protein
MGVPVALVAWCGTLVALATVQPAGRPVAVVAAGGVGEALRSIVAADGFIIAITAHAVVAISKDPAFVRRLYRHGAFVVLTARTSRCIVAASD